MLGRPRPLVGQRSRTLAALAPRRRAHRARPRAAARPTATRAAPSSTTCAGATQPDQLNGVRLDATTARRSPTGPRRTTVVLGSASLAALLAVGFIIANAIGGRILASRRDIGLLKAAGFTPGGVTALFVVENLLVAGAASVVGTGAGDRAQPAAARADRQPARHRHAQRAAARHRGRGRPRRRGRGLPVHRPARLARRAPGRARGDRARPHERRARSPRARRARRPALHMPPAVVLGVKDAFASRSRAAMTIASLALTMGTVDHGARAPRRPTGASSRTPRCAPSPTSCSSTPTRSPPRARAR